MSYLNKHNLALHTFTDKSYLRPVLGCVYVTDMCTVATDSYSLVRVSTPVFNDGDFPPVLQGKSNAVAFLLPGDAAKKAEKNIPRKPELPILANVVSCVSEDGKTASLHSAPNIESVDTVSVAIPGGTFPAYEQILPTEKPLARILLDASRLSAMAAYFEKHGDTDVKVMLEFHGENSALVLKSKTDEEQDILGLIMPCRINE